jgi:D-3-phosphoglycerate dehydrogenase
VKILVMQELPDSSIDFLRQQGAQVLFAYESDDWRASAAEVRALIYYSVKIDKQLLDTLPALEVIGKRGAGVDSLDLDEALARGIRVTNVGAGGNANAVSENALTLLLAATRGVVTRDAFTRAGHFTGRFGLRLVQEISGTRMGIVGAGNIGRRTADILRAGYQCEIGFYDPFLAPEVAAGLDARIFDDLGELFDWSANVIVAAPLTPRTRNMVGAAQLRRLGPEGVLVIASRGGIVDEAALVAALSSGDIRAAGTDVYDGEPPAPDHPFFALDNIVLMPHVGGASQQAREGSSLTCCRQVVALLNGGDAPLVGAQLWL